MGWEEASDKCCAYNFTVTSLPGPWTVRQQPSSPACQTLPSSKEGQRWPVSVSIAYRGSTSNPQSNGTTSSSPELSHTQQKTDVYFAQFPNRWRLGLLAGSSKKDWSRGIWIQEDFIKSHQNSLLHSEGFAASLVLSDSSGCPWNSFKSFVKRSLGFLKESI